MLARRSISIIKSPTRSQMVTSRNAASTASCVIRSCVSGNSVVRSSHAVRPAFLERVAQVLAGAGEIGDGTVARACAEVQRRFWEPPDLRPRSLKFLEGAGAGWCQGYATGCAEAQSQSSPLLWHWLQ